MSLTLELLSARYRADETASLDGGESYLTERRLAGALVASGWHPTPDTSVESMVAFLPMIIDACISGHHDLTMLVNDLSECLRHVAREHGDTDVEVADWSQLARRMLNRYANGESPIVSW